MMTVHKTLTAGGIDFIEPGEIYELDLFTADQIAVLRELWRLRIGKVQAPGKHQGTSVIQFVERKG